MSVNIQLRRGTSAEWTASTTPLLDGQPGLDTDKNILKIGDGSTLFDPLPVFAAGKQTVYIPASGLLPATTNGPSSAQIESATHAINYVVLDFDGSTAELAHFNVAMPKSWDRSTITFTVFWESTATGTTGVAWKLEAVAVSDGDTADAAYGTGVTVTDAAQSSAAKRYKTAESGAVTVGGTPANGDITHFRISRDPSNGADTMTEDARLVGLELFFNTNLNADN